VSTGRNDSAYIKTDLYVKPKDFRNGMATGDEATWVNSRIIDYLRQYTDKYLKLGDVAHEMTANEIRTAVMAKNDRQVIPFIAFAEKWLNGLLNAKRTGSHRAAICLVKHLKDFKGNLTFDEVTADFLLSFEKYMERQGVKNAIASYMRWFRVIFNEGRRQYNDEDRGIILIANYPWKRYRIKTPEHDANQHALTVDQLRALISYKPITYRERQTIDVFNIMLCMFGLNTKDIYCLKSLQKNNRISYMRSKTGHKFSIKVEPELKPLIDRYPGTGKTLFNFSENYKSDQLFQKAVNMGLKSICERAKWPKITTNWARHTVASILRNDLQIDLNDVGRCLGHASGKVTDVYIRYNYEIEDRINRKFLDYVFAEPEKKSIVKTELIYSN
jgi:integrase